MDDYIVDRLKNDGLVALSNTELFALLLADSPMATQLAALLVAQYPRVHDMLHVPIQSLTDIPGIGTTRAVRIKAALALAHRIAVPDTRDKPTIKRPSDAVRLVAHLFTGVPQEQLFVVQLNVHNQVIEINNVYIGSINSTAVRVAEVLRGAVISNSPSVILVHNHPSGNTQPSGEDIVFTKNVVAAGALFDIVVLDHIIVGEGTWLSMREHGIVFQ